MPKKSTTFKRTNTFKRSKQRPQWQLPLLAVLVAAAVGFGIFVVFFSKAATTVAPHMYMAASNTTTDATFKQFEFGVFGDRYVAGDWNADGSDTLGVRRGSEFLLANASPATTVTTRFTFGEATDKPIAGDWNGDKKSTIGVFRPSDGKFYLRNSNTAGEANVTTTKLGTGLNDQVPLACDWNGDGITDLGLFKLRTAEWQIFIRYGQESGAPWVQTVPTFVYGSPNDQPVCGDWDGNKTATVGIYRGDTFYLKNTNNAGPGWPQRFGQIGFLPLVGKWTGTMKTLIGAYYLGSAENVFGGLVNTQWFGLDGAYNDIEVTMTPQVGDGDYYYFANQVAFRDCSGECGAYGGLQTNGYSGGRLIGKMAIFSIWNATRSIAAPGGSTEAFGGEGVGQSVRIAYPWQTGISYKFKIYLDTDGSSKLWGASVTNLSNGQTTLIGRIYAPPGNGLIYSLGTFHERWGGPPASCETVPASQVRFSNMNANNGSVKSTSWNHYEKNFVDNPKCWVKDDSNGYTSAAGVTPAAVK